MAGQDDIYPIFLQDDLKSIHNVLSWVMRFNDVLDPHILHTSLCRLLGIDDWRYCGGCVRQTSSGKHEVHVPPLSDQDTPAVNFSHKIVDHNIADHAAASCIPHRPRHAAISPLGPAAFVFAAAEDTPVHIKDLITTDRSMVSLHITSFLDATILAISWPHTMTDVGGHVSLMQNWSRVLHEGEGQVTPLLGAKEDILDRIEQQGVTEERLISSRAMSLTSKLRLGSRLMYNYLWRPPVEDKMMFLPKAALEAIMRRTRTELTRTDPTAYITDGDILSAWAAKNFAKACPSSRPVTIIQMLGIRGKISEIAQAKGVYMQNMLQAAYIMLSVDMLQGPLCDIALSHRKQFLAQSTEPQVRATLCEARQDIRQGRQPNMFYGPPDALILPINNLIKTNYFQAVDFGPAVVKQGESDMTRVNPRGTMATWFNKPLDWKPGWLEMFYLQGRDHAGNMWMKGLFRPKVWEVFEQELEMLDTKE